MFAVFLAARTFHLHDFVFVSLAALAIFPDRTLEWVYQRWHIVFTRRHVTMTAVAALLMIAGFSVFLGSIGSPKFHWLCPIVPLGLFGGFRVLRAFVCDILGIRDE